LQEVCKHYIVTYLDEEHPGAYKRITIRVKEVEESYLGKNFIKLSGIDFNSNQVILDLSDKIVRSRFKGTQAIHILSSDLIRVEEMMGNNRKRSA
jgi:hypothetical protein